MFVNDDDEYHRRIPKKKDDPVPQSHRHPMIDSLLIYGYGYGPYNDVESVNHCCCGWSRMENHCDDDVYDFKSHSTLFSSIG
jgi:hypothetical protein